MNPPVHAPHIGTLTSGPTDSIADVAGVRVGHSTLDRGAIQTGVTVLYPHAGNLYCDKRRYVQPLRPIRKWAVTGRPSIHW